jgi:quercetin dioxygenase-like cupin family protein
MTTFIETAKCERRSAPGTAGEYAEIINQALCGAENVVGSLRWLDTDQRLDAAARPGHCQLVYLMEGDGEIELEGKTYAVGKGAGVFLDVGEQASVANRGQGTLKLFHLVVSQTQD